MPEVYWKPLADQRFPSTLEAESHFRDLPCMLPIFMVG